MERPILWREHPKDWHLPNRPYYELVDADRDKFVEIIFLLPEFREELKTGLVKFWKAKSVIPEEARAPLKEGKIIQVSTRPETTKIPEFWLLASTETYQYWMEAEYRFRYISRWMRNNENQMPYMLQTERGKAIANLINKIEMLRSAKVPLETFIKTAEEIQAIERRPW